MVDVLSEGLPRLHGLIVELRHARQKDAGAAHEPARPQTRINFLLHDVLHPCTCIASASKLLAVHLVHKESINFKHISGIPIDPASSPISAVVWLHWQEHVLAIEVEGVSGHMWGTDYERHRSHRTLMAKQGSHKIAGQGSGAAS